MDGTIIDSTNAIVKHWHQIGKEIGVDPEVILATSHGRRSIDVLEILEPSRANWECTCIFFLPILALVLALARARLSLVMFLVSLSTHPRPPTSCPYRRLIILPETACLTPLPTVKKRRENDLCKQAGARSKSTDYL